MSHTTALRAALAGPEPVLAPGVYDALSATLVEQAGFPCAYLSGASIAYSRLGRPDIGLVSAAEVADTVALIRERVSLPLVVDGDTGFGNALNVQRTVATFERAGASAIQLEDQQLPKRCGHMSGKSLVTRAEMVGKIKAATDTRRDADFIILARTDAIAVEGFEAALDRAEAYLSAGADMLFIEAPQDLDQMRAIGQRFAGRVPLLANMVEGGRTPLSAASDLAEMGFKLVIFPGALVRLITFQTQAFLADLKQHGATAPWQDRMHDFGGLQQVLGTDELLAAGKRYDADAP